MYQYKNRNAHSLLVCAKILVAISPEEEYPFRTHTDGQHSLKTAPSTGKKNDLFRYNITYGTDET